MLRARQRRVVAQQGRRFLASHGEQVLVGQAGHAQVRHAALARAEVVARAAESQVFLCDGEPVRNLLQDVQPLLRLG